MRCVGDPEGMHPVSEIDTLRANLDRVIAQRDEAQSNCRSLLTDTRLLRAQLDEAVALLRRHDESDEKLMMSGRIVNDTQVTARTPGPWCVVANMVQTCGNDRERVTVAQTIERAFSDTPNAAFIVTACNAHDGLVAQNAALREALADLVGACSRLNSGSRAGETMGRISHYTERAHAALAKGGAE